MLPEQPAVVGPGQRTGRASRWLEVLNFSNNANITIWSRAVPEAIFLIVGNIQSSAGERDGGENRQAFKQLSPLPCAAVKKTPVASLNYLHVDI